MNPQDQDPFARLQRLAASVKASQQSIEARRARRTAQEQQAVTEELRARWNAPKRHAQAHHPRSGPWGESLGRLQTRIGRGALVALIGPRGTGKTQMAVELMKDVTTRGRSALFRTATELLMIFKSAYRPESGNSELDVLREHRRPALLVIDEFARRAETNWEDNLLFELLNQRYADVTDTVLLCNLPRPELIECLGPSLTSRIVEGGGIVECTWPQFRKGGTNP